MSPTSRTAGAAYFSQGVSMTSWGTGEWFSPPPPPPVPAQPPRLVGMPAFASFGSPPLRSTYAPEPIYGEPDLGYQQSPGYPPLDLANQASWPLAQDQVRSRPMRPS